MTRYNHHVIAWGKEFAVCLSEGRAVSGIASRRSINWGAS
jgi:hypothetical protein